MHNSRNFLDPLRSIFVPDWDPLNQTRLKIVQLLPLRFLSIVAYVDLPAIGTQERECNHCFYWAPTMCQAFI